MNPDFIELPEIVIENDLPDDAQIALEKTIAGKTPTEIIRDAMGTYKKTQKDLTAIGEFSKKYGEMGWWGKHWNAQKLAENTNEAVLCLGTMSDTQMKMQLLMLWAIAKLGEQQKLLTEQQEQIKEQAETIKGQQNQIAKQQEKLKEQNDQLIEQQQEIQNHTEQLHADNEKLIEASEVLKSLRTIGDRQGKKLSDLETFYLTATKDLEDLHSTDQRHDAMLDELNRAFQEEKQAGKTAEESLLQRIDKLGTIIEGQGQQAVLLLRETEQQNARIDQINAHSREIDELLAHNQAENQLRDSAFHRHAAQVKEHHAKYLRLRVEVGKLMDGKRFVVAALWLGSIAIFLSMGLGVFLFCAR